MDNVLSAAGTSATAVGYDKILGAGVVYKGLMILGEGAILAGLILGAIVAFIIDRRFVQAAIFAGVGAGLSWIGLIHAPEVAWGANKQVALGYLFAALTCLAFAALRLPPRDTSADDVYDPEAAPASSLASSPVSGAAASEPAETRHATTG
jgi:AGZA family xanthine/uracil permease-like MFS transporter